MQEFFWVFLHPFKLQRCSEDFFHSSNEKCLLYKKGTGPFCLIRRERGKQEIHSLTHFHACLVSLPLEYLLCFFFFGFHFLQIHIILLLIKSIRPAPPLSDQLRSPRSPQSPFSSYVWRNTPERESCCSWNPGEWLWTLFTQIMLFYLDTEINNLIFHCLLFILHLLTAFLFSKDTSLIYQPAFWALLQRILGASKA